MSAKERYNDIINFIEDEVSKGIPEAARDISLRTVQKKGCGMSEALISSVIEFMSNEPIIPYIKSRQLAHAYKHLIDDTSDGIIGAVAFTKLNDQSAFTKAFKRQFNITPGEAQIKRDGSLFVPPQTWEYVSKNHDATNQHADDGEGNTVKEEIKFGVLQKQLEKAAEAVNLQAMYAFNDTQSEAAFMLAENYNAAMRDAFEFIDDFTLYTNFELIEDSEGLRKRINQSHQMIYTYFNFSLSVNESIELLKSLAGQGVTDITSEDPELLCFYFKTGTETTTDYSEIKELYRLYSEAHRDFDFEDFFGAVELGCPPDEVLFHLANERINPTFDIDREEREAREYEMIEASFAEETDYANIERFDRDLDTDNLEYEKDIFGDIIF